MISRIFEVLKKKKIVKTLCDFTNKLCKNSLGFQPLISSCRKFYKKAAPAQGDYINPPSGSVFDDVVTLPERYDFYLVSQSVRQGTVNPTSYNVIEDTSGWQPKRIQVLTYKLTHLYFNWSGTVRVPMVCQYAHKLAYLIGQSVHAQPHSALEPLLYYL